MTHFEKADTKWGLAFIKTDTKWRLTFVKTMWGLMCERLSDDSPLKRQTLNVWKDRHYMMAYVSILGILGLKLTSS